MINRYSKIFVAAKIVAIIGALFMLMLYSYFAFIITFYLGIFYFAIYKPRIDSRFNFAMFDLFFRIRMDYLAHNTPHEVKLFVVRELFTFEHNIKRAKGLFQELKCLNEFRIAFSKYHYVENFFNDLSKACMEIEEKHIAKKHLFYNFRLKRYNQKIKKQFIQQFK